MEQGEKLDQAADQVRHLVGCVVIISSQSLTDSYGVVSAGGVNKRHELSSEGRRKGAEGQGFQQKDTAMDSDRTTPGNRHSVSNEDVLPPWLTLFVVSSGVCPKCCDDSSVTCVQYSSISLIGGINNKCISPYSK